MKFNWQHEDFAVTYSFGEDFDARMLVINKLGWRIRLSMQQSVMGGLHPQDLYLTEVMKRQGQHENFPGPSNPVETWEDE